MKDLLGSVVSVSVPARAELVQVLRSVVGGFAARLDLSYDDIDDLRLAIDEACAQLLEAGRTGGALSLELRLDEGRLTITAGIDAEDTAWPSDIERSLAWQVVHALIQDTAFEAEEGRLVIRMRKAL